MTIAERVRAYDDEHRHPASVVAKALGCSRQAVQSARKERNGRRRGAPGKVGAPHRIVLSEDVEAAVAELAAANGWTWSETIEEMLTIYLANEGWNV